MILIARFFTLQLHIMLFGGVFKDHWRNGSGTLIALLNPHSMGNARDDQVKNTTKGVARTCDNACRDSDLRKKHHQRRAHPQQRTAFQLTARHNSTLIGVILYKDGRGDRPVDFLSHICTLPS